MKDRCARFWRPTDEELQELWQSCTFVPDTNVLFDLYRYPKHVRTQMLSIFESVKDRVWLPHQVAMEYMRKRYEILIGQYTHYDQCEKFINELNDSIDQLFK